MNERENDMDGSTTAEAQPAQVSYGADRKRDTPPGDPRTAIARATASLAMELSNFPNDQEDAHRAFNLNDPDASQWLDTLTPEEARNALDHLQQLADEHRRRANGVEALGEQIRQRFVSVAQWNAAPTALPGRG